MLLRELASFLVQKLNMVFRRLLLTRLFPSQLCCAGAVPIPKGAMSFSRSGFRPISITQVLSMVYERLRHFLECDGVFPRHQYGYRKGLGICDAMLDIV